MTSIINGESWKELNTAVWNPVLALGSQWLGKWSSSSKGYSIMVTDGIDIWGEQRNSFYIEEKAQEWAACLESGVAELAQLFLSQLKKCNADVRISSEVYADKLTIELTAFLDVLPYNWLFYLTKLHGKVVEQHWTLPITVTLELLSVQISKLEDELAKKNRQLEEYLPSQAKSDANAAFNSSIDISIQTVLENGIGKTLSRQLSHSNILQCKLEEKRLQLLMSPGFVAPPHNRPKLKKAVKGAFSEEGNLERYTSEEATQRSNIQALTQAPISQIRKKKRLNI